MLFELVFFDGSTDTLYVNGKPRTVVKPRRGYLLTTDAKGPAIMCVVCGTTSRNANDVNQKYCSACHWFHEDRL